MTALPAPQPLAQDLPDLPIPTESMDPAERELWQHRWQDWFAERPAQG